MSLSFFLNVIGKKKRKRDPNRPKRQHTAYTMFVQENYELIKRSNTPNIPSKDIISIVARQWGETGAEEKLMWKERANVHKTSQDAIVAVQGMIGQMTGQEQDLHGLLNADSQSHLEDVNDTTNVGVDTSKKRRAVRTQKVTKASAV